MMNSIRTCANTMLAGRKHETGNKSQGQAGNIGIERLRRVEIIKNDKECGKWT
jgi:hypothetical protein